MTPERSPETALRAEILRIAQQRGSAKTLCPSEAARSIGSEAWRDLMPAARRIAFELAVTGHVDVTQHGEPVGVDVRGPVRIRWVDPESEPDVGPGRDTGEPGRTGGPPAR